MSLWLRIKWWFEEQKSKLPGWVLIGWPIFWTIYTGIPDLFDATNFWIGTAKTVGGKIGLIATIIDSPWFNLSLFILGILYLRYVGEVQRPLRHPAWPILGWVVFGVVVLACWSVLVAGYVATRVPQQMAEEARTQIGSLTQTNQQLQQKVDALESVVQKQAAPWMLTDGQKRKLSEALRKVPLGGTHKLSLHALPNCSACAAYMADLWDIWSKAPGWELKQSIHLGLNPRLSGVVVPVDMDLCSPEELQLVRDVLGAAEILYEGGISKGHLGSGCAVVIGSKPYK